MTTYTFKGLKRAFAHFMPSEGDTVRFTPDGQLYRIYLLEKSEPTGNGVKQVTMMLEPVEDE